MNETELARVPEVGEKLHFFDDGKSGDGRHYLAVVTHVLTPEQAKHVYIDVSAFCELNNFEVDENLKSITLVDIHLYEVNNCDWLYAPETDYFVGCAIPEFDDHILWFVRKKDGGWFSMDVQSCWQGGYLDVDGERYNNNVADGHTYSERI